MKNLLLSLLSLVAFLQPGSARDLNKLVLEQIREMPRGGGYAINQVALIRLRSAAHFQSGKFVLLPNNASPSFCSGATYLIFLKTIEDLRSEGALQLDYDTLMELMIRNGQRDGQGVWGRWNANGPGTARLFHELGLGRNFIEFEAARPGDFMKIFWTTEIGKAERGHSVIYLGREQRDGVEHIRFWSSNLPGGYGEKSVPRTKIARAIFSRLERPENLVRVKAMPALDSYLAGLLTRSSDLSEAKSKCGI